MRYKLAPSLETRAPTGLNSAHAPIGRDLRSDDLHSLWFGNLDPTPVRRYNTCTYYLRVVFFPFWIMLDKFTIVFNGVLKQVTLPWRSSCLFGFTGFLLEWGRKRGSTSWSQGHRRVSCPQRSWHHIRDMFHEPPLELPLTRSVLCHKSIKPQNVSCVERLMVRAVTL